MRSKIRLITSSLGDHRVPGAMERSQRNPSPPSYWIILTVAYRRLSFLDLQSGLSKARSNQMRLLSNTADSEVELLVQFFQVAAHQIAHLHMLQMLPAPFG